MSKLSGTVTHVMRRFNLDKWGGTETVVFNLSRELHKNGLNSPIFCTDMFSKPGAEKIDGVTIRRFRYVFPWFGLNEEAKSKLRLKGGSPLSLPLFFALLCQKNLLLIHTHVGRRLGGIAPCGLRRFRSVRALTDWGQRGWGERAGRTWGSNPGS